MGNLNAQRDWGYAPEYCEGMWRMLQQDQPDDFVLATGETHSVREFVDLTFKELDMQLEWTGDGVYEKGIEQSSGKTLVLVNSSYYRPTEVDILLGDAGKAKNELGWESKTKFHDLVQLMAQADWEKVQKRGF